MLKLLIELGADFTSQDRSGNTLLHKVAGENKKEAVGLMRYLVEEKGLDPNLKNRWGKTAFDLASDPEIKKLLSTPRISHPYPVIPTTDSGQPQISSVDPEPATLPDGSYVGQAPRQD